MMTNSQRRLFFVGVLMIILHQAYMYCYTPPLIDEVYSWLFFGRKGFWTTLLDYHSTNNHILYNLFTSFWAIFLPDSLLAMRFTSILCFWGLLGYVFYYLRREASFETAFVAMMLIGLGFSQSIFGVQGRGYMLMALCSFGAVRVLLISSFGKNSYIYFVLWNVAGFFASPAFIYTAWGFYGYLVWRRQWKFIFWTAFWIVLGVFVLYMPMLIFFGWQNFLASHQDNIFPTTYSHFLGYVLPICLRESVIYLVGLPKYISFGISAIFFIFLAYQARKLPQAGKDWVVFGAIHLGATLFLIVATKTFPFYRIWTFYAIWIAILLSFQIASCLPSAGKERYLWVFSVVFFVASFAQFDHALQDFYDKDSVKHCKKLKDKFLDMAQENATVYLSKEAFYGLYWLQEAGKAHLLVGKVCEAKYAVLSSTKDLPACIVEKEKIWFLRFYQNPHGRAK